MYSPQTLHSTGKSQYLLLHCKGKVIRVAYNTTLWLMDDKKVKGQIHELSS